MMTNAKWTSNVLTIMIRDTLTTDISISNAINVLGGYRSLARSLAAALI
jgi:hypothetical protein